MRFYITFLIFISLSLNAKASEYQRVMDACNYKPNIDVITEQLLILLYPNVITVEHVDTKIMWKNQAHQLATCRLFFYIGITEKMTLIYEHDYSIDYSDYF